MRAPTPAVRAAVAGLAALTVVVAASAALHLLALRVHADGLTDTDVARAVAVAVAVWVVLGVALGVGAWYAGPLAAVRLRGLADAASRGTDATGTLRERGRVVGGLAEAVVPLTGRLNDLVREVDRLGRHRAALFHVSPHPTLLCSLDGRLVEANGAFYALTGLDPLAAPAGRLDGWFPASALREVAVRSLRERSVIGGMEAWLLGRDGERRPVEVALAAFEVEGRVRVLFQATERRPAAGVGALAADARQRGAPGEDPGGVVVAAFDAAGATVRWGRAACEATARPAGAVGHFGEAVAALALPAEAPAAFARWFWGDGDGPFVGHHAWSQGDGAGPERYLWRRTVAGDGRRTLVGMRLPPRRRPAPIPGGSWVLTRSLAGSA